MALFYAFSDDVRRVVDITNVIEALNAKLRRAVGASGHFPNDDAAAKLFYLSRLDARGASMENAAPWMAKSQGSVRHHVR